jgi:hypothetical protein
VARNGSKVDVGWLGSCLRQEAPFRLLGAAIALSVGALAAAFPLETAAGLVALAGIGFAARRRSTFSVTLLVVAVPFLRPFIFGERYSPIGIMFAVAAAAMAYLDDALRRRNGEQPERADSATRSFLVWVSLLWAWMLLLLVLRPESSVGPTFRSIVSVLLVLAAATVVLRDGSRRTLALKGFLVLSLVSCGSFAVTFALWLAKDYGAFQLGVIPGGYELNLSGDTLPGAPVFAPFTTTYGLVAYGGSLIPRFLGYGRESGMTAAALAWAYFMLPRVGWDRRPWKVLLLIGLAGTQSTAGFGVFVVVWVLDRLLLPAAKPTTTSATGRLGGLVLLVGAVYLAIYAPVFGIAAKTTVNPVSVQDRSAATLQGLHAITDHPLGQSLRLAQREVRFPGINVVASIAVIGIPGALLSLLTLTHPLLRSRQRRRAAAPTLVVLLTVLLAQPLMGSTVLSLLALLGCLEFDEPPGDRPSRDSACAVEDGSESRGLPAPS